MTPGAYFGGKSRQPSPTRWDGCGPDARISSPPTESSSATPTPAVRGAQLRWSVEGHHQAEGARRDGGLDRLADYPGVTSTLAGRRRCRCRASRSLASGRAMQRGSRTHWGPEGPGSHQLPSFEPLQPSHFSSSALSSLSTPAWRPRRALYSSCAHLNARYPQLGKVGARDHSSSESPKTNLRRSNGIFATAMGVSRREPIATPRMSPARRGHEASRLRNAPEAHHC